jgi:hypothetical protein
VQFSFHQLIVQNLYTWKNKGASHRAWVDSLVFGSQRAAVQIWARKLTNVCSRFEEVWKDVMPLIPSSSA